MGSWIVGQPPEAFWLSAESFELWERKRFRGRSEDESSAISPMSCRDGYDGVYKNKNGCAKSMLDLGGNRGVACSLTAT